MPTLQVSQTALLDYRPTPWDEIIFGFPCAEILSLTATNDEELTHLLTEFNAVAIRSGVKFAYSRVDSSARNKRAFHAAGFYFAEASYKIQNTRIQASSKFDCLIRSGPELVLATPDDHEAIREILAEDFKHGRIHGDPWVTQQQAADRYRNWLLDLINQEHEVYTYRNKGEVIGLHIQFGSDQSADLVLTGLKRSHALLGASLWADVLRMNRLRGVHVVHTMISAANIPIINLYRHFEFQFEAFLCGFHKRY